MSFISKKPISNRPLSDKEVNTLIEKGGEENPPSKVRHSVSNTKVPVQLRLSQELLEIIDDLIEQRMVKISRHAWFLEAIANAINQETKTSKGKGY